MVQSVVPSGGGVVQQCGTADTNPPNDISTYITSTIYAYGIGLSIIAHLCIVGAAYEGEKGDRECVRGCDRTQRVCVCVCVEILFSLV